ncbi:hypothetical protein [Vibrio aestuarianus]|uniref:hypothetical protein n=1 Tax=Vibrio aestuarianus TaxID=28171 RepID=UPI00237C8F33|nr:hypothetical protein [Vibrio aestuarianus]
MSCNTFCDYAFSIISGFALSLLFTIVKMNEFHVIGFSAIYIIGGLATTNAYKNYTSMSKNEFDKATKIRLFTLTFVAVLIWLAFEAASSSIDIEIRKSFSSLKVSGIAILLVYLAIWFAFLTDKNRTSDTLTTPQKANIFFIISNGICACFGLFTEGYINLIILAVLTLVLIGVETSFGLSNIKNKSLVQVGITSVAAIINLGYLYYAWPQH